MILVSRDILLYDRIPDITRKDSCCNLEAEDSVKSKRNTAHPHHHL